MSDSSAVIEDLSCTQKHEVEGQYLHQLTHSSNSLSVSPLVYSTAHTVELKKLI